MNDSTIVIKVQVIESEEKVIMQLGTATRVPSFFLHYACRKIALAANVYCYVKTDFK